MADLRSGGSKEYNIPQGFAFNYITCANYFFEIWGWLLFGVATQTLAAFLFIAAGGFQMMQWALQKHRRLRKVGASTTAQRLFSASLYAIAWKPDVLDRWMPCAWSFQCNLAAYSYLMARRGDLSTHADGSSFHPCFS